MTTATKTLTEISKEIEDFERDKGWLDQEFSFGERMALLHSEVSEALEAYRDWGLRDATAPSASRGYTAGGMNFNVPALPKPEGVAAEFADIFIRLVGDCRRDGVDLGMQVSRRHGRFGLPGRFAEQMQTLHLLIDHLYMAWSDEFATSDHVGPSYARVYVYLTQLCELHGIDLMAEYERKMAYNRTRPYRHGGKAL